MFVIYFPDTPDVVACDESNEYLDSSRPGPGTACQQAKQADTIKNHPVQVSSMCPKREVNPNLFEAVEIPLLLPLRSDLEYVLRLTKPEQTIDAKITESASIAGSGANKTELMVTSTVAIKVSEGDLIPIKGAVQPNQPPQVFASSVARVDANGILLTLKNAIHPLPGGQARQITIDSLTDYYGRPVLVKGSISASGAPGGGGAGPGGGGGGGGAAPGGGGGGTGSGGGPATGSAFIQTKTTAEAGVHQKPIFTFSGAVAPWDPAKYAIYLGSSNIRFDPTVNYDIGFNSTQSANSVIMPAPFSLALISGLPSPKKNIPRQELALIQGATPQVFRLFFGPRVELDQTFHRLNLLGELRGEVDLFKLSNTATMKSAQLTQRNPGYQLPLPTSGFSLVPYFQVDSGGHALSQTVTAPKGNQSVMVPTYAINRFYAGLTATAQASIVTVTLDSSYVNLLSRETIGYTTMTGAFLRNLEGWHPHTKLVINFALDPATKHYALSLTYQNGRSAPNFQYLNVFDAGFQVTY
ncbi:MAG: hypothetical protein ACLQOO_08625 [Terriglobia bacterium]